MCMRYRTSILEINFIKDSLIWTKFSVQVAINVLATCGVKGQPCAANPKLVGHLQRPTFQVFDSSTNALQVWNG